MSAREKFGLASPGVPGSFALLERTENVVKAQATLASFYVQFGGSNTQVLPMSPKLIGRTPMVTWEPWDPGERLISLASAIAAGKYDGYIRSTAETLRHYGGLVYLRFAHEMNGDWYPWGRDYTNFVAAWRHIRSLFVFASNVKFFWCPNVMFPGSLPYKYYWPGADQVDVVGVDGYNNPAWGEWKNPFQVFSPSLALVRQLAPGKPIIIGEVGCAEGGDKATWITDFLSAVGRTPDIKRFVWFDFAKPGEPDYRIQSSAKALAAFRTGLAA